MLEARPCTLKQANDFISTFHRHHKVARGHRFSISAWQDGKLVGIAIVGRPVARMVDQYNICEVTRLATDGTRNVCSFLYARCAQAAKAIGFKKIQTYTLLEESGSSLRGVGWECDGVVRKNGVGWNNRNGRRSDQPTTTKVRWCRHL